MKLDQLPYLDQAASQALSALCARRHVESLSMFGSGTTGKLMDDSDLDFLVEFQDMSPSQHADAYFGLLSDLEALFRRRIDLLERSAIENPYLLRGIERSRRLTYEAA